MKLKPQLIKLINSDPIAYMMVLESIVRYTDEVAESTPADYPDKCWIHPELWIKTAQDIQHTLKI